MAIFILGITTVLYSSTGYSNSNAQAFVEFLETTKQLSLNLDKINKGQTVCDLTKEPLQCNSASICSQLNKNGLYTYKNEQGQKQLNLAMVQASYNYAACGSGMKGVLDDDIFVYFEKIVDENEAGGKANLERNQKIFQQTMNHAEEVFSDVRQNFLKALDSRKNATNSAQIESLKKRIQSVKFYKYSVKDIYAPDIAVDCESPNAFYKTSLNKIIICPQMLNLPDGALFQLMAHELGHSMDSCNIAMDMQNGISYPAHLAAPPTSGPLVSKGMSPRENPYQADFQCLSSDKVIALPKLTKYEMTKMYNKELQELPLEEKKVRNELQSDLNWISQNYDRYSGCNLITQGHEQEASADFLGTEAVAEKLKSISMPETQKQFAFESTLASGNLCPSLNESALRTLKSAKGNHPCENIDANIDFLEKNGADYSSDHPSATDRVNNILLTNPEVRKALKCQGTPEAPYCGKGG